MLAVQSAHPSLRRACNHSALPRKGAGTGRDHSKALTTILRATGSPETLCTLHAPLINSRGLVADCGGYAVTCCVEEECVGWIVKRSKTGAGFATLFRLDFYPTAFAVGASARTPVAGSEGKPGPDTAASAECPGEGLDCKPTAFAADSEGTIMVAGKGHIHIYDLEGALQHAMAVPGQGSVTSMASLSDGRLLFIADNTMYMVNLREAAMQKAEAEVLVSHVKPSGGLALFPAANKLLFNSSRNSLCELDIESKECRVIDERMSTAGRLCSGTDKSALFTSPTSPGSMHTRLTPCSISGSMSTYLNPQQSALDADFCVNSSGDVLFFEPSTYNLTNLRRLPGLLPT